jgi:hypothetical protein
MRAAAVVASLWLFAISCGAQFAPASQVDALRILAVRADPSYARAGQTVRFRMTAVDALQDEPRQVQVVWLAGCTNPPGDQYFACYEQLGDIFGKLGAGAVTSDLVSLQEIAPGDSGVPDAVTFEWTLPEDIVSARPVPEVGPHYGIGYLFFAACAGRLAPAELNSEGSVPPFPLVCLDAQGEPLGADSFVPGYTQIYAFADERQNAEPSVEGLTLDDVPLTEGESDIVEVTPCAVPLADRFESQDGCQAEPLDERCTAHPLKALIGDVAEEEPDTALGEGAAVRETVWVEYFVDGGSTSRSLKLVSDAKTGYLGQHQTEWFAPPELGIVRLWAVSRDQRGGSSITRRVVRVVASAPQTDGP